MQDEPFAKMLDGLGLEARKAAVEHQHHQMRQFLAVRSRGEEGFDAQLLEPMVRLRLGVALHDRNHLGCQLERCTLEFDSTRCNIKTETKIYSNSVSLLINSQGGV